MGGVTRASLDKQPHEVAAMFDDVAAQLRPDQRRAVARPGPAVAQGGRAGGRRPARASGCSTSPPAPAPPRCRSRATGALRRALRLLPRHAPGGQAAPPVAAAHRGRRDPAAVRGRRRSTPSRSPSGCATSRTPTRRCARCYRVTRPGGRVVICEFSHPTWAPFRTVYTEYLMRALPPVARAVSSNPDAYVYLAESIRAWPDQPALAARLQRGRLGGGRLAQPDRRHRGAAPRGALEAARQHGTTRVPMARRLRRCRRSVGGDAYRILRGSSGPGVRAARCLLRRAGRGPGRSAPPPIRAATKSGRPIRARSGRIDCTGRSGRCQPAQPADRPRAAGAP